MNRFLLLVLCVAVAACSDAGGDKDAPAASKDGQPGSSIDKLEPAQVGDLKLQKFGNIYLAGQPSADDLAKFEEAGIKTVINLRSIEEKPGFDEAQVLSDLGIAYHNPGFKSAEQLSDPIFHRVRDLLANKDNEPILLHCASGNRVGAVWLAHRVLDDGVPYEKALEEAVAIGMKPQAYEARVKAFIESKPE